MSTLSYVPLLQQCTTYTTTTIRSSFLSACNLFASHTCSLFFSDYYSLFFLQPCCKYYTYSARPLMGTKKTNFVYLCKLFIFQNIENFNKELDHLSNKNQYLWIFFIIWSYNFYVLYHTCLTLIACCCWFIWKVFGVFVVPLVVFALSILFNLWSLFLKFLFILLSAKRH